MEQPLETAPSESLRTCPDCGWNGVGNYCANCGEEMEPYLPKVRQFFHELASEFLALDSKIIRTIPNLFRPGFLTKEYLAGRRRKYLLPWRLYTIIAVLLLFEFTSLHPFENVSVTNNGAATLQPSVLLSTQQPEPTKDPEAIRNGHILIKYFFDVAPYAVLIGSVPLFALLLKMLYWKKKRLYVEHLIFSFHFFAFAAIVFAALIVSDTRWLLISEILVFLIYLYFALRSVYRDKGFGLVLRFCTSTAFYFVFIVVGILLGMAIAGGLGMYFGELHRGQSFHLSF
ncbi:MAG TPA: DUF3667 domain-containing protein [Candidatus Kapabacteria bacterium]|nr:DUF3667 domain-containing protein [Candidatus Kapabacteria bacterium]